MNVFLEVDINAFVPLKLTIINSLAEEKDKKISHSVVGQLNNVY